MTTEKRRRKRTAQVEDFEEQLDAKPYRPPGRPKGSPKLTPYSYGPGIIWNVYDGPRAGRRLMGIVNQANYEDANLAAMREWPDRPRVDVVRAELDPDRRRDLIRPEFLLPIVTTRMQ